MTTTILLDPSNVKLIHGEYTKSKYFEDLIIESEGCARMDSEFIEIESNGSTIVITYDIQIAGTYTDRSGNYLSPDITDVKVNEVCIDIKSVEIDENEVVLTSELITIFVKIVKNLI